MHAAMFWLPLFGSLALLYLLACLSPGPNWLLLSQLAATGRRRDAVAVAIGIACGSTIWAVAAMAGIAAILMQEGWFAAGLRIAGACWLIGLGASRMRSGRQRVPPAGVAPAMPAVSRRRLARDGLLASLGNPKAGAFWIGVFAGSMPLPPPFWFGAATVAMIACLSAGFHVGICYVFGTRFFRQTWLRHESSLGRATGALLLACGLAMLAGAVRGT